MSHQCPPYTCVVSVAGSDIKEVVTDPMPNFLTLEVWFQCVEPRSPPPTLIGALSTPRTSYNSMHRCSKVRDKPFDLQGASTNFNLSCQ
jgi:hypothetical protein